jgi:hypothetical protein
MLCGMTEPTTSTTMTADNKTKPAYEVRLGRVKATLWANSGEHGTFYNTTAARLYKDGDGKWQQSDSFSRDELPVLIEALRLAYLWQFEQAADRQLG